MTLYVCFEGFCWKAKRDKSIPPAPPVPNKVKEGGIIITQKIQDLSGFNFKVQCPCLGKTCWSILANAVGFLKLILGHVSNSRFINCVIYSKWLGHWDLIRKWTKIIVLLLNILFWHHGIRTDKTNSVHCTLCEFCDLSTSSDVKCVYVSIVNTVYEISLS